MKWAVGKDGRLVDYWDDRTVGWMGYVWVELSVWNLVVCSVYGLVGCLGESWAVSWDESWDEGQVVNLV